LLAHDVAELMARVTCVPVSNRRTMQASSRRWRQLMLPREWQHFRSAAV
jgi:hypothetical protein